MDPLASQRAANASAFLTSSLQSLTSHVATASVSGMAEAVTGNEASHSLLVSFFRVLVFLLSIIPGLLFWLITFTTITLPTWLFTFFSVSLTFTMNATTLLLIAVAIVSTVSWFVRYRVLNMYTRLPSEPQRREPQIDLYTDTQEGDSKPGLTNYLDEFLSGLKIFGYLERPVFHELTRSMQTKKLISGETILLEEEKGFSLVVDGVVQIFVKSQPHTNCRHSHDSSRDYGDDEDERQPAGSQGYQLLTEVKNGSPMSSLFSILSLFTEDIKLPFDDDLESSGSSFDFPNRRTPESSADTPEHMPATPLRSVRPNGVSSDLENENTSSKLPNVPPLRLDPAFDEHDVNSIQQSKSGHRKKTKSAHPDIVARAVVDTTIAIVPASAFRRLTRVYPKATAHIVQVILTRLQRVTFSTAHKYLGLTTEVLQIEKLMNKFTSHDLPNHLRGAALDRLKDKFTKERERIGPEEVSKGIALHNPGGGRRRRSSSTLRKEAVLSRRLLVSRNPSLAIPPLEFPGEYERGNVSPGDLHSDAVLSKRRNYNSLSLRDGAWNSSVSIAGARPGMREAVSDAREAFRPSLENGIFHRQESIDEDSVFRESILSCMVRALGLSLEAKNNTRIGLASVDQSPRLVSYDAKRQTAVFNNAFGMIDPYESADGETESASVTSLGTGTHGRTLNDELIDDVEVVFFPKGTVLVEQGERNPGVYYVIDGFLDVSLPVDEKDEDTTFNFPNTKRPARDDLFPTLQRTNTSKRASSIPGGSTDRKRYQARKSVFMIKPGGIAGYVGTISSYRSITDVTAKTDVYVGFLPRASLERVAEKYPVILLTMAKRLTSLLPRLITHIDFALEWEQVNAGQVIHHQGDESDAIYIVLNGRLRAVLEGEDGNARKVVGEFGQGESVGELEVLTESKRPATLHAIRDTELAKFPRSLFNSLAQEHPNITIQISKLIAQRMRALIEDPTFDKSTDRKSIATRSNVNSSVNLRTVAVLPVGAGVPVVEFGSRLQTAFNQIGVSNGITSLNQSAILSHLGRHAFSRMGRLKLAQYLADLEEKYGMVLYIADTNVNSPWMQTCISQADCILLVALAEGSYSIGEYERCLLRTGTTARKELVLLHPERYSQPGLSRKWLQNRPWINGGHHHVHMAYRTAPETTPHAQTRRFGTSIKQRVQVIQAEIQKYTSRRVRQTPLYSADTPFKGDMHRLARRLCGRSVGLVLGGGGARGISQVGVIRALEEAGIPIDIVGGTSIGAFIGALYARDADVVPMYGRAKKFAGRMGSMWRFALDLTYPTASYTTGHEFNRGIFKTFGNSQIEDFWLEFYCNTTNISKSRSEIHTSGYVWRYVRASMSLAGLIPPLCDEGNMLLDGGYIDNLTVAHMKSLGADLVFAVDVGSLDDDTPQAFGDSLSGFWAFFNRWNPFSSFPNPPTLSEIQARLAYVSSVDALERAKNTPGCLYLRPPIDAYGTLDFAKFDEIYEVGYNYGKEYLSKLKERGELKGVVGAWDETEEAKGLRRTMAPRRASI